jgi:glucose/arabinose dehydrogenase
VKYLYFLVVFALMLAACTTPTAQGLQTQFPAEITAQAPSPTNLPPASMVPSASPGVINLPTPSPSSPGQPPATVTQGPMPTTVTAFPDPQSVTWKQVADGLNRPVALADPGDGSGRLFVLEQPGIIRIIQNGAVLPTPFLDIQERVGSKGNEQGLLGIAFHPHFAQNGFFFVNYTDLNGNTHIVRFSVSQSDPNQADPNSEKQLLFVDQPFQNHNGGSVVFGPDGYLYLGLGDGGSQGDPHGNAQSTRTYLGKILRIDVDKGDPYAIPADNPFATNGSKPGGGLLEIWAYGLRNPWRFSFDRLTNELYIADVGQDTWEEIDYLPAGIPGGENFGWNYREGMHPYKGTPPAGLHLVEPIAEYNHSEGCSVTGGFVYRGEDLPNWRGVYLYGDYCSGKVWGLLHNPDGSWQQKLLFETGFNISSFGEDAAGELYLVDLNGGVYRLSAVS